MLRYVSINFARAYVIELTNQSGLLNHANARLSDRNDHRSNYGATCPAWRILKPFAVQILQTKLMVGWFVGSLVGWLVDWLVV